MTDAERAAWLAERKTGVASTDIAAILGLSPWKTAFEIYLDKLNALPEQRPTPAMLMGLRLEPIVAEMYTEATNLEVAKPVGIFRHPVHAHLICTPDRIADDGRLVELKTTNAFADGWGEPGTDEIPDVYALQCQHQMAVMDIGLTDVPVLIGGVDFAVYHLERSEAIVEHIVEAAAAFWDRVQRRDPPEPTYAHPGAVALMKRLHGLDGTEVQLGSDAEMVLATLEEARLRLAAAEREKDEAQAKLLHAMGSAARAYLPDGTELRRTQVSVKEHIVKAHEQMRFTVKPPKGRTP